MFGSLGIQELLLIFVIILIVFGPRRIPEIGRTLGKALGEFRKATDDLKSTIEREVRLEELKQITPSIVTPFESVSRSEPPPPPPPPPPSGQVAELASGQVDTPVAADTSPTEPLADSPTQPPADSPAPESDTGTQAS
jgi:TatA/E family protein of Tat protein translocase